MNAKKIMGAVLVALLAAALFVGAGAAATNYGTVFVYQDTGLEGTWTGTAGSITFVDGVVAGENIKEGKYTDAAGNSLYLSYPSAAITAIANNNSVKYPVIGGNLYEDTEWVNLTITSPAGAAINNILITYPDGTQKQAWNVLGGYDASLLGTGSDYANGTVIINLPKAKLTTLFAGQTGTFKLQAMYVPAVGSKPLVDYTPVNYLVAKDAYTINVVSEEKEVTISASVDKVLEGKTFTVTITGMPGETYTIAEKDNKVFTVISAGANTVNGKTFDMPNTGSITLFVNSTAEDEITLTVGDAEVTIEILEATLTATLGAPSYFIGNDIEVTLTTDGELADAYVFNITGTNVAETQVTGAAKKDNKKDVYTVPTDMSINGKKLDVGTYTIKIYTADKKTLLATLPVALKQPFISIVEAPEVIAQGTEAKFTINAEATTAGIQYYIFGTNYFETGAQVKSVKNTPNQFVVTIDKYNTSAENMSAGQYFAVFQHPMYDGMFNINATKAGAVSLYSTTAANTLVFEKVLFNVSDRQTANAAQAICDALDSQNIDDMYVKYSFFVVGQDQSFTMSEIPTEIVKGDKLVISGVSTANKDAYVTAEMISTAFAAVPKETVGSAAFIAVTTQIAEDGTWEVTFDTSDLNVDEYSLKVACGDSTWKNVNINVVEGADKPDTPDTPDVPDTPDTPDTPTEPETPGFGALAALAGLGAVAVLLLRRE